METPVTRTSTPLGREQSLGLSIETPDHRVKLAYRRSEPSGQQAAGAGLGLVLGALIMAAVWAYGFAVLGGAVLAALILIAVYRADRG